MNKNNIAILIVIVLVAAGFSYGIGTALLGDRVSKPQDVEVVDAISSEIAEPDKTVFANDAINPTVQITISDNNQNPLGN